MYVKLFNSILHSSVWDLDIETRMVWITLLAMCDSDGVVNASVGGIANAARLPLDKTQKALEVLMAPDPDSRSQEYEGRRIEKIGGFYEILNYKRYRCLRNSEERKTQNREAAKRYRERRKIGPVSASAR